MKTNNINLYEHKADAEWDLEFENVEKRIKFVKPKPFKEVEGSNNATIYKAHGFEIWISYASKIVLFTPSGNIENHKPFNEENYTEACRLIKKLFKGENHDRG